ncbi:hypothetical protein J6590_085001 [Homalodisca vitripennis]|nr:hypothetical protein J6590_085001 [Homalodisca vitripennis]
MRKCASVIYKTRTYRAKCVSFTWQYSLSLSRTEEDLALTDFDKDKREAIVSLPRKMLVKYKEGNHCQHQKSSTICNNKKYTEENSV